MAGASVLRRSAPHNLRRRPTHRATWRSLYTENLEPRLTRGRDHLKIHGTSYLKHAPMFLALWSVRRAHPALIVWTVGKTGLELAQDPKIRAAVTAAAQKLRRK